MNKEQTESRWIHCPICNGKTRTKVYSDIVLVRFLCSVPGEILLRNSDLKNRVAAIFQTAFQNTFCVRRGLGRSLNKLEKCLDRR